MGNFLSLLIEKKTLRHSTQHKSKEAQIREKERAKKNKLMKEIASRKTNVSDIRRLTQEELLEEAKITEEINLRSLGRKPHCYCYINNLRNTEMFTCFSKKT